MQTALLVVHLFVALGLIGLVLMQRSEGGALGLGGGGGGGLITGRGAADLLARVTTGFGAAFLVMSLILTILTGGQAHRRSVVDKAPVVEVAPKPVAPQPEPIRAAPLEEPPLADGAVVAPAPSAGAVKAAPALSEPAAVEPPRAADAAPVKPKPASKPRSESAQPAQADAVKQRAGPDE